MDFADARNNTAFRETFGNVSKTEILISPLNTVAKLEGSKRIARGETSDHALGARNLAAVCFDPEKTSSPFNQ